MNQNVCVITGATSGIGKAAAFALAKEGCQLILLGRNEEKAARVCREIRRDTHNQNVNPYICDLSVLRDVRSLASRIKEDYDRIDILINNAGARFLQHRLTKEGKEMTLATNHLGHFVLTLSLIERLKSSGRARIINVSSGTHWASTGVIENVLLAEDYDGRIQYSNSKLANILFTYALADRLKDKGVTVNAVDPGGVATNFARNNGWVHWLKHRLYYMRRRQLLTPEQGAQTLVDLASSALGTGVTGRYFKDRKEIRSSDISYDKAVQEKLWTSSVGWSGIDI